MKELSLLLIFMEGLLSFLSPCVLPIIPLYMGYLSGDTENKNSRQKIMLFTVAFVLGILSSLFIMNLSLQIIQGFMNEYMTLFVRVGGILVIALGVYQLGFIKSDLLQRTVRFQFKINRMNIFIAFALGFAFSFAWTPCVGPALSSILILSASTGDFWYSQFLMLVYALGFTLPFLILGMFTHQAMHWIKNHQSIMKYTTKIGAIILILFGLMMFTGKLNTMSQYMSPTNEVIEEVETIHSFEEYKGKVVFVNFWATWCPPCLNELPEIQKLSEKYKDSETIAVVTVVSPGGREKDKEGIEAFLKENHYTMDVIYDDGTLMNEYSIRSLPTSYMLDNEGNAFGRVIGQLNLEMMENMIDQTLNKE